MALWREGNYGEIQAIEDAQQECPVPYARRHRRAPRHGSLRGLHPCRRRGVREIRKHLRRAYPLALVATIAPLLGLLGTVIGMIGAFDKVSAAGSLGDASMLGGDISKALITTATGLCIAVPALALYHFFKSRTNMYGMILEEEVCELITRWFATDARGKEAAA